MGFRQGAFSRITELDRTILDETELLAYYPFLRGFAYLFVFGSSVLLAALAYWDLLRYPLWVVVLAPFLVGAYAVGSRHRLALDPRRYYVALIHAVTVATVFYVHASSEPLGTLMAFVFPVVFSQAFFLGTPRTALIVWATAIVGLTALRSFEMFFGLRGDLAAYPQGVASMLGVCYLLTLEFAVVWVLAFFVWQQKENRRTAHKVLEDAYRELRTVERARTEFLSSMTHELKTPLVTVRGYIDLALRGELPAGAQKGLRVARRSAQRLQRLIDELLMSADPSSLNTEFNLMRVPLNELLQDEIANFANQAAGKDVTILQVCAGTQDAIWADPERVGQVLSNLISNALRYSRAGGVIEVGSRALDDTDMLVWVSDQGPGIAPDKLQHLFEEHYVRGVDQTGRGMGMGLIICKRLVSAMGGRISVESAPGAGTTFSVTFPTRAATPLSMEPPKLKRKALVLDDETDVLSLMEYHLVAAGYVPTMLQNGTAAYDAAMQQDFDLLLLDVNVPGLTGVEVSRRLREAGRPGRILLFSALIRNDAERLLVEARADGFLPKPFDFDQIARVLKSDVGSR